MAEHPIREMKEMRRELWRGRRTLWIAVVICSAICVIALIVFSLVGVAPAPGEPMPVDPVAAGAESAFDVIPATPSPDPSPAPTVQPVR